MSFELLDLNRDGCSAFAKGCRANDKPGGLCDLKMEMSLDRCFNDL